MGDQERGLYAGRHNQGATAMVGGGCAIVHGRSYARRVARRADGGRPVTDNDLLEYLGLTDGPAERLYIATMKPKARAAFENLRRVEQDIHLWQQGVGPKPTDAILCMEHKYG